MTIRKVVVSADFKSIDLEIVQNPKIEVNVGVGGDVTMTKDTYGGFVDFDFSIEDMEEIIEIYKNWIEAREVKESIEH
jgi:hypothetical protein